MASILGAQIATLLYDTILLQGEQSVTRKPWVPRLLLRI